MGEYVIKMPDIGEGVAEAELVEWEVEIGAEVREDQILASVMTDKATVEIPAPRDGKVIWLGPEIGDTVAVGSAIIRLEVEGEGNAEAPDAPPVEKVLKPAAPDKKPAPSQSTAAQVKPQTAPVASAPPRPLQQNKKPLASPSVRKKAMEAGIDLRLITGSGKAGRITHKDYEAFIASGGASHAGQSNQRAVDESVKEIKLVGLRRKIAQQMSLSKSRIPHITYVEEIDMTALEELRAKLNADRKETSPKLTLLPFLMRAIVRAIEEQPQMNARFDDEAGIIHQYAGMHIGVAAQTDNGLVVPVVHHAQTLSLWECASELSRLANAAREGSASRGELTGSTITITSLGKMGGIVTTPVINHPEVAIIGVNKMRTLPVWQEGEFVPRKMMNLSSSFDHRVIDGWDAAVFIQRIKSLLESPATIFIED